MISQIDHLGIAVNSLETAITLYRDILGLEFQGSETVPDGQSRVAFFKCGEVNIELLEPTGPDTPIAKFLAKRGEGIHHVCLRVDDIDAAREKMSQAGLQLLDEKPREGAHHKLVSFFHPKSTRGVLMEIAALASEHGH